MICPVDPLSREPRELLVPTVRFLGEQDGAPECRLKSQLIDLFKSHNDVRRAYLAQIFAGDHLGVALCLRPLHGADRDFVRKIGVIFAAIFHTNEHLDIVFLNEEQELALLNVCAPFFTDGRLPRS